MKNRKALSPILLAAALSLVGSSAIFGQNSGTAPADSVSVKDMQYGCIPVVNNPPSDESAVTIVSPNAPAKTPALPAAAPTTASAKPLPPHTANYTVVKGDTLTKLAVKFNSTRKKLEELNSLADEKITPGQIILVPSYKKTSTASAKKQQPVQDFDIPASTFASCPVPPPTDDSSASADAPHHAPVAKLVSPAELDAEMKKLERENAALAAARVAAAKKAALVQKPTTVATVTQLAPQKPIAATTTPSTFSARPMLSTTKMTMRTFGDSSAKEETNMSFTDWGTRFVREARALGDQGLDYDDDWRPPGENRPWTMDCSNTTRYLYKITAGISLPRTASDQYYYLHLQGKAWDVPQTTGGVADANYLRQNLKPGDLLFWENTYRPERQPPITHVMIFLGTNDKGQWIMAGSQCSHGGEHNRRNGGPDIYLFRPWEPCGGYTTWLGMVHHQGRFVAFGRPLEADRSKLASD